MSWLVLNSFFGLVCNEAAQVDGGAGRELMRSKITMAKDEGRQKVDRKAERIFFFVELLSINTMCAQARQSK